MPSAPPGSSPLYQRSLVWKVPCRPPHEVLPQALGRVTALPPLSSQKPWSSRPPRLQPLSLRDALAGASSPRRKLLESKAGALLMVSGTPAAGGARLPGRVRGVGRLGGRVVGLTAEEAGRRQEEQALEGGRRVQTLPLPSRGGGLPARGPTPLPHASHLPSGTLTEATGFL